MADYEAKNVMNGTWGELWLDDEYVTEITAFQAKDDFKKEAIEQAGKMTAGQKITSIDRKGSLTMNKINSRMAKKIGKLVDKGQTPTYTIVAKINDPDALGSERYSFSGVVFDDLTIMDWEVAKTGKVTAPFTYQSYTPIDQV